MTFDPERHPTDLVSQSSARATTGQRLKDNYEDCTRLQQPADMQFLCSIAIARVMQLEAELSMLAPHSARVIPIRPNLKTAPGRSNRPGA